MAEGDITAVLQRLRTGDPHAQTELFDLVYEELRRRAAGRMRSERSTHTLQATALVHETYIRLLGSGRTDFKSRAHFFAVAATAMRNILVDHAKALKAGKRGAGAVRTELTDLAGVVETRVDQILTVSGALEKLKQLSPRQVSVVEMRFFCGFTEEEIAAMLGLNSKTIKRDWSAAKAWLQGELAAELQLTTSEP